MNLSDLDGQMVVHIVDHNKHLVDRQQLVLLRAGSSLHPEQFGIYSDIDYFLILEELKVELVNNWPDKISPNLDVKRLGDTLHSFYWKVTLKEWAGHPINIHIYTKKTFEKYCESRSGPKMYLLNEHLVIYGGGEWISSLRDKYKPNLLTAESDLKALVNPKYKHRFLWAWRSVCLLETGLWLKNKKSITHWVDNRYPKKLDNKDFLHNTLLELVNKELDSMNKE